MRMRLLVPCFAFAAVVALLPAQAPAQPKDGGWQAAVDKAVGYLKKSQNEDGSWGPAPNNTGVTGIVTTGLLRCGVKPDDEPAAKGVKFVEGLINAKAGHIAGKDDTPALAN